MTETKISRNARALSSYPARKIRISCEKCGLNVQYDRDALIAAGGDRGLPDLLSQVAERKGCTRVGMPGVSGNIYDRCMIVMPEISKLDEAAKKIRQRR